MFSYLPAFGKFLWPHFLALELPVAWLEPLSLFVLTLATFLVTNGVYFAVYSLEWQFFERYKVNLNPWPWQQNKAEF